MIKDRHGTLTAPRRDNRTQTKRETDQLGSIETSRWMVQKLARPPMA